MPRVNSTTALLGGVELVSTEKTTEEYTIRARLLECSRRPKEVLRYNTKPPHMTQQKEGDTLSSQSFGVYQNC
jgi:hypothetical protein